MYSVKLMTGGIQDIYPVTHSVLMKQRNFEPICFGCKAAAFCDI